MLPYLATSSENIYLKAAEQPIAVPTGSDVALEQARAVPGPAATQPLLAKAPPAQTGDDRLATAHSPGEGLQTRRSIGFLPRNFSLGSCMGGDTSDTPSSRLARYFHHRYKRS